MSLAKMIHLLGYGSGLAAADPGGADGPKTMRYSPYLADLVAKGLPLQWEGILSAATNTNEHSKLEIIAELCKQLATQTKQLVTNKNFFTVLGGDHSSAIGT